MVRQGRTCRHGHSMGMESRHKGLFLAETDKRHAGAGDLRTCLKTGRTDILFSKSESPVDIADRIEWVLRNHEVAYDIASRGKAQVYDNFSSISQARHLINSISASNKNLVNWES